MAWFVYDENSARALKNHPEFQSAGVTFVEGNPLLAALGWRESVLLLPGTVAEAPFVLHIQNNRVSEKPV
jgi:hypothetical protein